VLRQFIEPASRAGKTATQWHPATGWQK